MIYKLSLITVALVVINATNGYSVVIDSDEILYNISIGQPIIYDNVTVRGDLDITHLGLSIKEVNRSLFESKGLGLSPRMKIINSPISISNSRFEGNINFKEAYFSNFVGFRSIEIKGETNFIGSTFKDSVYLGNITLQGNAYFDGADFNSGAYIGRSRFNNEAYFRGTKCSRDLSFNLSKFSDNAFFGGSGFSSGTNFYWCEFAKDVYFDFAAFLGYANFDHTTFGGSINFKNARFSKNLNLNNTQFHTLILTNIEFINNSKLAMQESEFGRGDSSRVIVDWDSIKDSLIYDGAIYIALIKNFKNTEKFTDADNCYFQYMDLKRTQEQGLSRFIDDFASFSCGYGVKPERPVTSSIIILLIFGIIYSIGYRRRYRLHLKITREVLDPFYFSAIALFSLPKELYPYGEESYSRLIGSKFIISRRFNIAVSYKLLVFLERLIGWGLLILFINTLSRVMIRY